MDHLKQALSTALGGVPAATTPSPSASPAIAELPDPLRSPWVARLRALGATVPLDPSLGQLLQLSDRLAKTLKTGGRARDAAELGRLRDDFVRARQREAWARVKTRFAELDLPERTYRSLKQEEVDPERLLGRLTVRRSEELRGMGAARLREALLEK